MKQNQIIKLPDSIVGLLAWSPVLMALIVGGLIVETKVYVHFPFLVFGGYAAIALAILFLCYRWVPQEKKATGWAKVLSVPALITACIGIFFPVSSAHMFIGLATLFMPYPLVVVLFIKFGKL